MINVDEILLDPDFMVWLVRVRLAITINGQGVAVSAASTRRFKGSMTPKSGNADFEPQGQRKSEQMLVITKEELIPGDNSGNGADIVQYGGKSYTVVSVNDYGVWGAGFYAATCELVR